MKLIKGVRGYRKSFFPYLHSKRKKDKENASLQLSEGSDTDIDKIEVLNPFFSYHALLDTDKIEGGEERLSQQSLEKSWLTDVHGAGGLHVRMQKDQLVSV